MTPVLRRRVVPDVPLLAEPSLHPVLARVYAARGVVSCDQLDLRLSRMLAPSQLGGLEAACALLRDAIAHDARIVIVGDFDCDGATGAAVAYRGLRLLGARHVAVRVPNRAIHGYGLTPALVEEIVAAGVPDLLITVDSGIACLPGVRAAKQAGCRVLVTDHHLPPDPLPEADAIVNPNLRDDAFPSKVLAGVGVMFYLLLALRASMRESGAYAVRGEPDLSALLDLVALGTVADVVPLDQNNRVLVAAGLKRIRAGKASAGVAALIEVSKRRKEELTATDLGFSIGPRVNAAGRLEDMQIGIACLCSDDPVEARELAARLDAINSERRGVQQDMVAQAEAAVAHLQLDGDLPPVLCLHEPEWHAGVIGLVASKIKERVHRPVFAFASSSEGSSELKASARSVPGVHLRDLIAELDMREPGLILRFGGHAMAAGLSLEAAHLARFRDAMTRLAMVRIDPAVLAAEVWTDGELSGRDIDLALAEALREGGPWGQSFPEPLFDGAFDIVSARVVGERHVAMRLVGSDGVAHEAIAFGAHVGTLPSGRIRVAFQPSVDEWRGDRRVKLLVRHFSPA
ncbi:MAG TPA: single-stranded-DNA-specific exonuclease RecJ [Patescibacteria group bacterium]|nr:single-stranded-DNA-specific exonuclease RecJ [Patescibacteria group bacterium]